MCIANRAFFVLACLLALASLEANELEIVKLDFDLVDQANGREPWYQIAVTFSVEKGDRAPESNPRFMDDVAVRFSFATESERSGGRSYAFYSAGAEYPSLEVGRHVARFYLPPELVKRDRVRGEPYAYMVEVVSAGQVIEKMTSASIRDENRLAAFKKRVQEADQSVLRLQAETPFAWTSPRDTPVAKSRDF